jgi:hypothetical protein
MAALLVIEANNGSAYIVVLHIHRNSIAEDIKLPMYCPADSKSLRCLFYILKKPVINNFSQWPIMCFARINK